MSLWPFGPASLTNSNYHHSPPRSLCTNTQAFMLLPNTGHLVLPQYLCTCCSLFTKHSFSHVFHDILKIIFYIFFFFLFFIFPWNDIIIYLSSMRTETLSLWGTAIAQCFEQSLKHDRYSTKKKKKRNSQWHKVFPNFSIPVPPYHALDTDHVLWCRDPFTVLAEALCDLYIISLIFVIVHCIPWDMVSVRF